MNKFYTVKLLPILLIMALVFNLTSCSFLKHNHDFSEQIVQDAHLAQKASCTSPATYYFSCSCGEIGTDTFTYGKALSHTFTAQLVADKYLCAEATKEHAAKYYYACSQCKQRGTKTFVHGEPLLDKWEYNYYVDYQFNEKTDDWYIMAEELDGTFENSATDDAVLMVDIGYDCDDCIIIFLYEYAKKDNLVKNSSSQYKDYYEIVVKNEKGTTYNARGQMHPGEDRIFVIDTYHASVLKLMKTSSNLKFYIRNEDTPTTQYRFDVDMNNFNDVLAEMKSK